MISQTTRRQAIAGMAALPAGAGEPLRLPRKVRVGLIGIEGHTSEITSPLKNLPDVELVAVADPSASERAAFLRSPRLAGARQYDDWRRLLDAEKLDIAAICGPNGDRAAIIRAAAERKLHIIAEKPLAITRADFDSVRQAVARHGVRLSMLLPMRFLPPYLAMRQIVESGQIGEVAQMGGQKSYKLGERPDWMRRHASFGGTIPYIGIHLVDLMRFTSKRELIEAASFQNRIGFPELADMENTTSTIFRLDNGGTAAMRLDYLRPETAPSHGDDRLRLAGTGGILEYQVNGLTLIPRKQPPRAITDLPPAQSLFTDFLRSVYHGTPAALTLDDIYKANAIVLAARESAERHTFVKV
jgi:predicted dehydrogenase